VGTNRYAYAANNPINVSDPSGHSYGPDEKGEPEFDHNADQLDHSAAESEREQKFRSEGWQDKLTKDRCMGQCHGFEQDMQKRPQTNSEETRMATATLVTSGLFVATAGVGNIAESGAVVAGAPATISVSRQVSTQAAESAVPQITKNKIAGDALRDELAGALRAEGRDVATEVYKRRRLVDGSSTSKSAKMVRSLVASRQKEVAPDIRRFSNSKTGG